MNARLLRPTIALLTLLGEIRYTISRLTAANILAAFLDKLIAARAQWTIIQAKEIAYYEELSDLLAQIDIADDRLDDFAMRFSNAILALTGQKRDAKLYLHFFKKPLHELIRPTLGGQLATMANWITSLGEPGMPPSLVAMLPDPLRLAIVVCDVEGLPADEAAALLRTSPARLRRRLHRARMALRHLLERNLLGE